ncbi:MAG: hypothetical protein I8H91_03255 [Burkholderiales bacterium]|nr:hypothetical protein [Burkholderiales bacterium]
MKSAGRFQSGKTKITGTVPAKEVPPTLKNFRDFMKSIFVTLVYSGRSVTKNTLDVMPTKTL